MNANEYLAYIERQEIPPYAPTGTSVRGFDYSYSSYTEDNLWNLRAKCTKEYCLWTVITTQWTRQLADWIGGRKCLEIMAGAGWLAKALSEFGVSIVATDNHSWGFHNERGLYVHPVERLDGVEAVKKYHDAEILIVSWPPYGESAINDALDEWGSKKPVVYIGEGEGGCNANDDFFVSFYEIKETPEFYLFSYPGIHDSLMIGYWTP